tara:strand:- start:1373 stop:2530 length:1158 start_codon:yes stop_codon:yes gene_type:complete
MEKQEDFPFIFDYENKKVKKLIEKFYKEIKKVDTNKKRLPFTKNIIKKQDNMTNDHLIDLLDSDFTPPNIKKEMDQINDIIEYSTNINNIPITINFLKIKNRFNIDYDAMFQQTCLWLLYIFPYSNSKIKSFNLVIYLSHHKKKLPKNQTTIFNNIHCNTAVTYACAINGNCLIYREEEWFKVLIHETMHAFCLDFSGLDYKNLRNKMKSIFPLKIDFEISETYSEFWATILNCLFKSYILSKNDNDIEDFDSFYYIFSSMIHFENAFSLLQTVKILDFMNINEYKDLYENKVLYKQKTNVFEYYILKMVFLFHYIEFLLMCDDNNINCINFQKSQTMLNKIFTFVKKNYKNEKLSNALKYAKSLYNELDDTDFIKKTMRMTMFD